MLKNMFTSFCTTGIATSGKAHLWPYQDWSGQKTSPQRRPNSQRRVPSATNCHIHFIDLSTREQSLVPSITTSANFLPLSQSQVVVKRTGNTGWALFLRRSCETATISLPRPAPSSRAPALGQQTRGSPSHLPWWNHSSTRPSDVAEFPDFKASTDVILRPDDWSNFVK